MRRKKDSSFVGKMTAFVILIVFGVSLFAVTQFGVDEDAAIVGDAVVISGYTFYDTGEAYVTFVEANGQEYEIDFLVNPADVKDVNCDASVLDVVQGKSKVYIVHNPNAVSLDEIAIAYNEVGRVLEGLTNKQTVLAYTVDSDPQNLDVPLRDCKDVDYEVAVELASETEVISESGCVLVRGENAEEIERAASKLAMWLAGAKV